MFIVDWSKIHLRQLSTLVNGSSLRKRLVNNSIWSFTGMATSQIVGFLVSLFAARLLGKSGFGQLGLLSSIIGFLTLGINLGLALTSLKYISQNEGKTSNDVGEFIGFVYVLLVIISSIFLFLYFTILFKMPLSLANAPLLTLQIRLCGVIIVLTSIASTQTSILMGFEEFKLIFIINIIRGVTLLVTSVAGIHYFGLNGALFGLIIEGITAITINQKTIQRITSQKSICLHLNLNKKFFPIIYSFSLPAFLTSLVVPFVAWVTNSVLSASMDGYNELGQFNAAFQWRTILLFLPMILGNAILPIIASEVSEDKKVSSFQVVKYSSLICFFSSTIIALGMVLGKRLLLSMFGRDFGSDPNTFLVLIASTIIAATVAPIGNLLISLNQMWMAFIMNFGWGIILISSSMILINKGFGALGLSLGYLTAYLFHGLWTVGYYIISFRRHAASEKQTIELYE